MKYIKIKAHSYNEAMMKLKMEHGDDAIPISHKYVREGGLFKSKLFAKEVVELTAAVQERKASRLLAEKRKLDITIGEKNDQIKNIESADKPQQDVSSINKKIDDFNANYQPSPKKNNTIHEARQSMKTEKHEIVDTGYPDNKQNSDSMSGFDDNFKREFNEIKSVLQKIMNDKDKDPRSGKSQGNDEDEIIKPYLQALKNNDFDIDECNSMISEVKNSISKDDLQDKYKIERNLKDLLKSKIVTTGPIKLGNRKKVVMFIGPTGVGKTTTMAKLGAINSLREGHSVVFLTLDNYRIAATEQLKKYAEIMRIPVYACNDQKEFKDIITKEKADIIMVDTSGRSHKNDLKISEIKSFVDMVEYDFEKILCISANTKKRDVGEIVKAFNIMDFDSIIITKVDETSYIGNVVDIADKYNKPISYFSNGQEVPNDIIVADPDKIVDMMIRDINT